MLVVSSWVGLSLALLLTNSVRGEILTPPYFNLAEGKKIYASATCGEDTEGPELYCKLVGANSENDGNFNLIQGQFCDICDPSRPDKMHPPEFAVDGMETWWQSPPLSRGMKYNEVNLTIDLGQEFHVAYVFIRMGNSPRPGLWILEKSSDYGKTFKPWQYFSDSTGDCEAFFGRDSLQPISKDDSVICSTEYSKIVPLEGGEIPISLLNNRPSAMNYFNSSVLQDWTRATNVRFRFLRTKNLLGHLMSVARQDPTVTRRYFYSIKDISIGGRCMCNGHADSCDNQDISDPIVLICRCQHNTCGSKCETCCPGYEQKAWRISKSYKPFVCEPCNCFLHSNECVYDEEVDKKHLSLDIHGNYEGGGVCQNCQHNTEGVNCNRCKSTFYRPHNKHWNETDACQPCNCDMSFSTGNCEEGTGRCECRKEFTEPDCKSCSFGYYDYPKCKPCECFRNGTVGLQCEPSNGDCPCKENFGGKYCKECSPEYFNFPECIRCECNPAGSISSECDQTTGNCTCKSNYGAKHCDQCQDGYFNYPNCLFCNCDVKGTKEGICDKETGKCWCKLGYGGARCDQCIPGYYGYPDCKPCNCSSVGSASTVCDASGKCPCLVNFAGRTCNQCSPGYYKFPECLACNCDSHGGNGISCDGEGRCQCFNNFDGNRCDQCKEGFYNFPSCEDCNCHPAGVVESFAGCGSVPAGELCQCKERVEGRICNKCKPLYWNLIPSNPDGCEECKCDLSGTLGGIAVCDTESGQCTCKPSVVSRSCAECEDGTYNLQKDNLFGCTDCGCDIGGSLSPFCDKTDGQCICQSRVTGRTCNEPIQTHYFPTLYQYQYEVEDGRTPQMTSVRYSYNSNDFPHYSWRGYAVFNNLQNEILQDIYIFKPSVYIMVLRYVNSNPDTVIGTIKITPDNPLDIEQKLQVQFKNSSMPASVVVSGATGIVSKPFVLNPGRWTASIKIDRDLLVDYFVLLPEEFYLATILKQTVDNPCNVDEQGLCRDFSYPNISQYDVTWGGGAYIDLGNNYAQPTEYFKDHEHLTQLSVRKGVIPLINNNQQEIDYHLMLSKPGHYVILINYITPKDDLRTHLVDVDVITNTINPGKIPMYSCIYSSMCRQVVTTKNDKVGVYQVEGNDLKIKLRGNDANVGIHSIVAIPYEDWSMDFIQPRPVCIRKDGQCVKSSFLNPPESKKIQFEQEMDGSEGHTLPPVIVQNTTSYVFLSPKDRMIDLKGKVPEPGQYVFVVHYTQPDFPKFNLDVLIQNGQFYDAKLPVQHCPSVSGCRALIIQEDGNTQFSLTENFMITHKLPHNENVYLDYLLVVPADVYSQQILREEELNRASEFIVNCGSNHFNIDTSENGFCRDSVFTITAGYNNGALPCNCDYDGSLSFECEKFGGQCQCKPNMIGRQCSSCKTGYYGFPDCQPCNCPSTAYCEPATGVCICPRNVMGKLCDQCEPLTYGFHPLIGCEECNCNPLGIKNTLQCDLFNGSCPCKENIVGRKCDICQAGYYLYPHCDKCACDIRGTTEEICDQESAECLCKKNLVGPLCSICREGTFNLQASNTDGCTDCFCFGKTTRCHSSNLARTAIFHMSNWTVIAINETDKIDFIPLNLTLENIDEYNVILEFSNELKNKTVYFAAPKTYLGKKITSYGGNLKYSIFYTIGESGKAVMGPDVILVGGGTYLTYNSIEQPAASTDYTESLELVEANFILPSGLPANREHIMVVLEDLQGIYIRAIYWSASYSTKISNVFLDDAVDSRIYGDNYQNLEIASSVEQCLCPPNYQGLSCEECAPGHYRISSGPHGGYCVPCQCNGHTDECDVNTGICINCQHSTTGQHCEKCDIGYHGNAVQGTPRDCLICACPLPIASNNFATGCDVSSDGEKISCDCVEGYFGARCQSCAPGYYGKPELLEDYCKPCQCSGNINPDEHGSCDTVTGECMRCLNNTFGEACALCAPGYFGDAITLKDCQSCVCDIVGTDHCDSYNGECQCKPNVIGEKCDRCELEHYGFQSGSGCIACNCEVASTSDQCDDVTGQCRCKVGVTGRNCDRCAPGFWNYTIDGCISCGCKTQYSLGFGCNAQTGQCECLTGVIGEKCDQCPHRWAFVKDYGCHKCDSCTHDLLDTVDMLANLIDPVISDFDSADSGFFTARRLIHITETFQQLKPRILQLDPNSINLTPIIQELESLEQDSMNMNRKANYSLDNSKTLVTDAKGTRKETDEVLMAVYEAAQQVRETIDNIKQLSLNLSTGEGPKIDAALQEAEAILNDLQLYNLTEPKNTAEKEFDKVENLIDSLLVYKLPVDQVDTEIKIIKDEIKDFNEKLDDLYNHTQYSINKAKEADSLYAANGKERVEKKLANIVNQTMVAENNLKTAEELLTNASRYFNNAKDSYAVISKQADLLEKPNNLLNTTLETTYNKLTDLETIVPAVQDHASNLSRRAEELVNILTETQGKSDNALRAANAYNDIGAAIEEAQEAAKSSKEFVDNASLLYGELQIEIADASTTSDSILDDADAASRNIEELKPKIKEVENKSRKIRSLHSTNEDQVNNIERFIKGYQVHPFNDLLLETINITEKADGYTQNTLNIVGDSYKEVPQETDQAKKLPKKLDDANRDILQVEKHLETINEKLPKIMNALNDFPSKQGDIKGISEGIEDKIKKLNQQIAVARDMANQIKVGVKFYRNTTLELRNPPNLVDLSTSTHISGYFKTDNSDGLIVYLGNGEGTNLRRTKTDDYMALEVENGYPVLTLDIGNGPERIVNSKYVADNQWYQFIIDRNGLNAKLTIKEQHSDGQTKETVTEEDLEGPYTIFNLDRNQSKLFVGSFPPEFHMQEYVKQNSFEGEMEDLVVGDTPVSLWNFNSGYENNHGCRERDKLVNLNPSTGCRFNGYGYVILDARSQSFKLRSNIKLDFKTFASNGLLFLYGKGKTFIALEISNGTVVYKYNLGGETKVWQTKAAYSDGKWHKIVASRDGPKGQLEVDGEVIRDDGKHISGNSIDFSDYLFFGGYPQSHNFSDVTNVDFDGCIQDVNIRGNPVDLLLNHRAYGITPGCPVKFARLVSFAKMQPGYVNVDPFYVHNNFKMTLKFKTPAKDGLIFYATDKQQTNGISLSITDGRLKLISQKIELISKDNNFNDSEWHVISIRHNHKELRLDFDDYDYKVTDSPPPMLHILYGNLFIGGLPENFVVKKGTVASALPFIGCIGDASLNGTIINFANSTDKAGDVLGRCLLDKQIDSTDIDTVPTLPPLGHLDSFTTHRPDIFTEDEYKAGLPQRGDGGQDVGEEVDEFDIEETESPDESSVISTVQSITTTSLTTIPSVTTWPTPRQHPATTKAPIIVPLCALPIPESPLTYDAQNKDTKSFRFGTANYSRIEYDQARGKYRKQFDFSFDIKTNNENGLIFYAANTNQDQFVTLYIKDGHFVYMFNGGAGTATLRTELTYNDDIWHNVLISREQSDGKLVVDEILQSEGKTPNPTNKIDLNAPFFIGGIPPENQKNIFANTKMTETFQGCIRNFKMNGKDMEKTRSFNVSSCPDNVEVGTFFGRDGGYVNLKPKFKVGLEIDIKLDIKPRNLTGLLVSVYGKRDYLVLEMINGVIKFTVENGKGPISASFEPDKNNYFCDGEWHSIQAVKSKSVVTLSVDKTFTQPAIGDNRSQSTDTGGVLFLGGHRFINRARAIVARVPYVGCVKNVYINNIYVNISNSMVNGDVALGYCPTD